MLKASLARIRAPKEAEESAVCCPKLLKKADLQLSP
jgi:hypothetical protein